MPFTNIHTAQKKSHFIPVILKNASRVNKKICFPEYNDPRILQAVSFLIKKKIVKPVIVGHKKEFQRLWQKLKLPTTHIKKLEFIDITEYPNDFATQLTKLRSKKGMTLLKARKLLQQPMYFATMLLHQGVVDGIVAGAAQPTANTFRPALQIIKTKPGVKNASSYFIMLHEGKVFFYADCAFNIDPNARELAEIAISTADSAKSFGFKPKVALLSYSTKGSATHSNLDKIKTARKIVKQKRPDIIIDGELQFDTAVVPEVAKKKAPQSPIQGDANILIFPSLNAGNIAYKIAQRFAHDLPIGPISQGIRKPVNDLSRGCTIDEIIEVAAITALQVQ